MKRIVIVLSGLLLMAVLPATTHTAARSQEGLSGRWVRDDVRGDSSFLVGEYPGMVVELRIEDDALHVRQSVGRVRDGQALPGSGDEHLEFTLPLDGTETPIPGPRDLTRTGRAELDDVGLRLRYRYEIPDGGEDTRHLAVDETWSLAGGDTLVVVRTTTWPGQAPDTDRIVFRRESRAPADG